MKVYQSTKHMIIQIIINICHNLEGLLPSLNVSLDINYLEYMYMIHVQMLILKIINLLKEIPTSYVVGSLPENK